MSVLVFASALSLGTAALLAAVALASDRPGVGRAARLMGALGAAAVIPGLLEPGSRSQALFAIGVGLLVPRPLPLLLGALAALLVGLHASAWGTPAALVLAVAAVAAARAFSSTFRADLAEGLEPAWAGAGAGLLASLSLLSADHGRILHWRLGLGEPNRLEMPGAGCLLGLAFLVCLGGSLLLIASLVATPGLDTGDRAPFRWVAGRRALIIGWGLLVLSAGLVSWLLASRRPAALAGLGRAVALLWGAAGLLTLGLILLLGSARGNGATGLRTRAQGETSWAVLLSLLALAAAGVDSWAREGTSVGGAVPALLAAVVLGLAAREGARWAVLGRAAFLTGLLYLLVVP
jgi:hypothetical protein